MAACLWLKAAGLVLLVACGGTGGAGKPPTAGTGASPLTLADLPAVELAAGTRRDIQILTLGGNGGPVSLSATGLPGYASLAGDLLTLAPTRLDVGEVSITLTATNGAETASKVLVVRVTRTNEAPVVGHGNTYGTLRDADGSLFPVFGPVPHTDMSSEWTLSGTPTLSIDLSDGDGDAVRLFVERVPEGTPFTNVATYSSSPSGDSVHTLALTGLTPGTRYDLQLWAVDAMGAEGAHVFPVQTFVYAPRGERSAAAELRTCGEHTVNVTEDPQHCGACGRGCGEAACERGLCVPTRLVSEGLASPLGLAVGATELYWNTQYGRVYAVPLAGGPVRALGTGTVAAWTETIGRLELDGEWLHGPFGSPSGLARAKVGEWDWRMIPSPEDCEGMAWFGLAGQRMVLACGTTLYALSGEGAPTLLSTRLEEGASAYAADAHHIYWLNVAGQLRRAPLDGGEAETLASVLSGTLGLDDTHVYVAGDRALRRFPKAGGPGELLASLNMEVGALAIDGDFVYWSNGGRLGLTPLTEGSVMRMPRAGGSPEVVADGFSHVNQLAFDAQHVYWLATLPWGGPTGLFIERVRKP